MIANYYTRHQQPGPQARRQESQQALMKGALEKVFAGTPLEDQDLGPFNITILEPAEINILTDALSGMRPPEVQAETSSRFDFRRVRLPGQPGRRRLFRAAVVKTADGVRISMNSSAYRQVRTDEKGDINQVVCDGPAARFTLSRMEEPDRKGYAHWQIGALKLERRYRVEVDIQDGLLVFHPEATHPRAAVPFKLAASGAWMRA